MVRSFNNFRAILMLSVTLAATMLVSTGCRSMSLEATQSTQQTMPESPSIGDLADVGEKKNDNVKALESFLARTETYSLSPAGAPLPASEESRRVSPIVESPPPPAQKQPTTLRQYDGTIVKAEKSLPRVVFASIVSPQDDEPARPHANETITVVSKPAKPGPTAAPVVKLISIRSHVRDDESTSVSPPTIRVNHPVQGSNDAGHRTMDDLLEKLVERAVGGQDVSAAWEAGLIYAALRKPMDAGSLSHALSHNLKPLFLTTIDVVRSIRKVVEDNPAELGSTLEQLESLHRIIADQADPSVNAIAMCSQVTTFGVFEEMSMSQFVAGRATPTIVYSELENLSAQQETDGSFRTELATRIEIFTAEGQSILNREEPKIVDHCRRHRRDFFIAQRITLPATMQPGDYVLKVFVEDKLAGRASEGSYPFSVGTRSASIGN